MTELKEKTALELVALATGQPEGAFAHIIAGGSLFKHLCISKPKELSFKEAAIAELEVCREICPCIS